MRYEEFLKEKAPRVEACGIEPGSLNPILFPFQADITRWAIRLGRAGVFCGTGLGKAQPVSEPVMTPCGWKSIGELAIGDFIISVDGGASAVTGIFRQGLRAVFKVTMNDGSWTRCDGEHLWRVTTDTAISCKRTDRTLSTNDILRLGLANAKGRLRWRIPMASSFARSEAHYQIDPYVLGVLLGDGCLTRPLVHFCCVDREIVAEVHIRIASNDCRVVGVGQSVPRAASYRISSNRKPGLGRRNPIVKELDDLGLIGVGSFAKFIPTSYLLGSTAQRVELLRGLMDTDGYIAADGTMQFTTVSERLRDDMTELIQSLGGVARVSSRIPTYEHRGEKRGGRRAYTLTIALPRDMPCPFRLSRKVARWRPRPKYIPARKIASIAPDGFEECVCISVSHPSQLYVTRGHIVTHNTFIQLEWARHFAGRVLIVAPLAVSNQTIEHGNRLGLNVRRADGSECIDGDGIYITNYERIHRFVSIPLDAIVLDESSRLKSLDGKQRTLLIREFTRVPRRLCCTATPAPNDVTELCNHAEFLGAMARQEMLATFFVHDADDTRDGGGGWRLKGHAAEAMWRWMATWAVYVRSPEDLGYDPDGFLLPDLHVSDDVVPCNWRPPGQLFACSAGGIGGRHAARRNTIDARVARAAELCHGKHQCLVWCGLNDEGRKLKAALKDDAVLIEGATADDAKCDMERDWRTGSVRVMITKASIFGFGLNWQHCHKMIFLGLGDSWEQYYQAIRRCWRFGQKHAVDVRIVLSDADGAVASNIRRKERDAATMAAGVVAAMKEEQMASVRGVERKKDTYRTARDEGRGWVSLLGDNIEHIKNVETGSVGLSVFSPPFASLYTYSASDRDMGNCRNYDEFFKHFGYLVPELLRVTMPGRRLACHVQQVTTTKVTHGLIGWRDFRADVVRLFVKHRWVYDGEVVIDKDPQAQAIRTKALRNGTPVLTPKGWCAIESLSIGDQVIGSDGHPTRVTQVSPQGHRELYCVRFNDGAEIACDAGHLWAVNTEWRRYRHLPPQVMPLHEMIERGIRNGRDRHCHEIPLTSAVEFDCDLPRPLDPYLLGVLLGDGGLTQHHITLTTEHEIVTKLQLPAGVRAVMRRDINGCVGQYGLSGLGRGVTNPLTEQLRDFGLIGHKSKSKFIPQPYLFASLDERWALLQGLLDSDGMVTADGSVRLSTSSSRLADDIQHLVRSLGGIAKRRSIATSFRSAAGERKSGLPSNLLILQLRDARCPFRLSRKVARWRPRRYAPHRQIVNIARAGSGEATCIAVEASDGLFVTDKFIVTHNSKQLLFVQKDRDSAWLRPAMADYILLFRHPREAVFPVKPGEDVNNEDWILWARPIWYDISESDTLGYREAREAQDEKHICPLQFGTIERCVRLWSNVGDLVLDPFMGIGSTGHVALNRGRRFLGIELKESYYSQAVLNLKAATAQPSLFESA